MIRIATKWMYDQGVAAMQSQQSALVKTQEQLATGRRVLTPADDPVASAEALRISQADELNTQYARNQGMLRNRLDLAESVISSVDETYQQVRSTLVQAGNGAFADPDRTVLATQLQSLYQQLIGLANSRDGNGRYLFSGGKDGTQPFTATASGASYNGDEGQRLIQVSASRQLATSDNGSDIFERGLTGNGVFVSSVGATNAGSAIISQGLVSNPGLLTGHDYQIQFSLSAGVTTYAVQDMTSSAVVSSGNSYTAGSPISFGGMQMSVDGTPAAGDTFDVKPSRRQSVFATLVDSINLLNTSAATGSAKARLATGLTQSIANIDHAFDRLQNIHTDIGTRMAETDALESVNSNQSLVFKTQLSKLRDIDYAATISTMSSQQQSLSAAQQSYAKITKLTLFDFI